MSEFAGYLNRCGSKKAYEAFFMENPFLDEVRRLTKKGKTFSTAVNGVELEDILRQHCVMQQNSKCQRKVFLH